MQTTKTSQKDSKSNESESQDKTSVQTQIQSSVMETKKKETTPQKDTEDDVLVTDSSEKKQSKIESTSEKNKNISSGNAPIVESSVIQTEVKEQPKYEDLVKEMNSKQMGDKEKLGQVLSKIIGAESDLERGSMENLRDYLWAFYQKIIRNAPIEFNNEKKKDNFEPEYDLDQIIKLWRDGKSIVSKNEDEKIDFDINEFRASKITSSKMIKSTLKSFNSSNPPSMSKVLGAKDSSFVLNDLDIKKFIEKNVSKDENSKSHNKEKKDSLLDEKALKKLMKKIDKKNRRRSSVLELKYQNPFKNSQTSQSQESQKEESSQNSKQDDKETEDENNEDKNKQTKSTSFILI